MKIKSYIIEKTRTYMVAYEDEKIADIIRKNCQPFLNEAGKFSFKLYRGSWEMSRNPVYLAKKDGRQGERRPQDTPLKIHNRLNDEFEKKFGWRVRNGIFTTGSPAEAIMFGKAHHFFPIGEYKYAWSSEIADLTDYLDLAGWTYDKDNLDNPAVNDLLEKLEEEIDVVVDSYTDRGLKNAIRSQNEISFNCKQYYMLSTQGHLGLDIEKMVFG